MTKNTRFSPEVRQRAVRMVLESQDEAAPGTAGTEVAVVLKIGGAA